MLDNNLEQINKTLQHLSKRVNAHDLRFDELDEKVDLIAQTLSGHDLKFVSIDERFEQVDRRFEQVDRRFEQVDRRFEQMVETLVEHDQRLANIEENMVTKKEFRELINTIDYSVKAVNDMKEDHVFGMEWMKRMQEQLGWHEQDIRKLKLMLNLA